MGFPHGGAKKSNIESMVPPLTWKTTRRRVSALLPYDRNPRQMSKAQAKQLERSLRKFGLVEIPAIDLDNRIVAGHMRIATLKALGRGQEEIDVRVPSRKLTEGEFREYNVVSNNTHGEFDLDILTADFDLDELKEFGFNTNDLKLNVDKIDDGKKTIEKVQCPKCGHKFIPKNLSP